MDWKMAHLHQLECDHAHLRHYFRKLHIFTEFFESNDLNHQQYKEHLRYQLQLPLVY